MTVRDLRPGVHEQWSERNQTLRHGGEKQPQDDEALLDDPHDYSAVGGPENERAYGRTRSDNGHYPWNPYGGPHDRDTFANHKERGGYIKLHEPDYGIVRHARDSDSGGPPVNERRSSP